TRRRSGNSTIRTDPESAHSLRVPFGSASRLLRGMVLMPTQFLSSGCRTRRCPDDLVDALAVKPDGNPARSDEDGYPIPNNDGSRMIHFKPLSPVQFRGEDMKWFSLHQSLKDSIKVLCRHDP